MLSASLLLGSCSKSASDPEPDIPTPIPEESLKSLSTTTLAGGQKSSKDGVGTSASFDLIVKVSSDKTGIIYVLEYAVIDNRNHFKIRKITTDNKVTTLFDGGYVEFDTNGQNAISANKLFWSLNDIAVDATGNIYALGSKIDYTARVSGKYIDEKGIFKLNQSTSKFESFITAKTTTSDPLALTYAFDNFATDGNGNFYCTLGKENSNLGKGEIYKVTLSGKELMATIDKMFADEIFADNGGNIFVHVPEGITKISPQKQTTSYYKFEKASTVSFKGKLTGDNSGNLILFGPMFKTTGEELGDGFYKVSKEGKKVHIGKIASTLSSGKMSLNNSNQLIFTPTRIVNGGSILMRLSLN